MRPTRAGFDVAMFKIRTDHLLSLDRAVLVNELVTLIQRRTGMEPDATSLPSLRAQVREAMRRAIDVHGLTTAAGIADFVGLSIELGPGFEADPVVAVRLAVCDEPPEARLCRVFEELRDQDWTRLRAARDEPALHDRSAE